MKEYIPLAIVVVLAIVLVGWMAGGCGGCGEKEEVASQGGLEDFVETFREADEKLDQGRALVDEGMKLIGITGREEEGEEKKKRGEEMIQEAEKLLGTAMGLFNSVKKTLGEAREAGRRHAASYLLHALQLEADSADYPTGLPWFDGPLEEWIGEHARPLTPEKEGKLTGIPDLPRRLRVWEANPFFSREDRVWYVTDVRTGKTLKVERPTSAPISSAVEERESLPANHAQASTSHTLPSDTADDDVSNAKPQWLPWTIAIVASALVVTLLIILILRKKGTVR